MGISEETNLNAGENQSGIPGSSVNSPAPLGFTVKTTIERGDAYLSPEIYNVEMTVLEVIRGNEALEHLRSQGVADKSPEVGYEYVLANIRVGYFQRGRRAGSEAYELKEGLFVALSADGQQEYGIPAGLPQPQPILPPVKSWSKASRSSTHPRRAPVSWEEALPRTPWKWSTGTPGR